MEATYHAKFGGPTMFRLGCVMEWAEWGGIILNYEESCNLILSQNVIVMMNLPNSGDIKNETEFLPLIIIHIILKTDSKKYDS